jgi:hypothetical protein
LVETEAANRHLSIEDFISDSNDLCDLQEETWLDSITAVKLKAERDEALSLRVSIKADLEKIKNQVCHFLHSLEI